MREERPWLASSRGGDRMLCRHNQEAGVDCPYDQLGSAAGVESNQIPTRLDGLLLEENLFTIALYPNASSL